VGRALHLLPLAPLLPTNRPSHHSAFQSKIIHTNN
jgi:hypothetical protein